MLENNNQHKNYLNFKKVALLINIYKNLKKGSQL